MHVLLYLLHKKDALKNEQKIFEIEKKKPFNIIYHNLSK